MTNKENRQQKVERIAVGLAVGDELVDMALTSTLKDFNKALDRHKLKRRFDGQIEAIGYDRAEFWREVKKMKRNPDYHNPDVAYDDDDEHDDKP